MSEEYKWYPVYTNPRAEKKAFQLLNSKGIETYLALQKRLKQWSDRKKWVEEPLIPSYIFVKVRLSDLSKVLITQGICRFIYFSGRITSMPAHQIDDLKLLLATQTDFQLIQRTYTKGEEVEVTAGPLKGMRGELVEMYSQKKILIRIGQTGQSILVQIPAAFLESRSGITLL